MFNCMYKMQVSKKCHKIYKNAKQIKGHITLTFILIWLNVTNKSEIEMPIVLVFDIKQKNALILKKRVLIKVDMFCFPELGGPDQIINFDLFNFCPQKTKQITVDIFYKVRNREIQGGIFQIRLKYLRIG